LFAVAAATHGKLCILLQKEQWLCVAAGFISGLFIARIFC